ncbi:MAG: hypothetical protein K9N07_02130 [Candidatus Cloacimonetes bacterium]|nr:hypothetical protein [Candidatus Cloacimonadota bacterium]
MKKIPFIIIIITIMSFLYSYSVLENETGNMIGNIDPYSAAMGSAVGAGGFRLLDSAVNPANLTSLPNNFGFQTTGSFVFNSDNRSLPMYNSFDAYSGEAVYVSNVNIFTDFAGGVYYQLAYDEMKLAASMQYRPLVSFKSDYQEEVRNNRNSDNNGYPPKIAQNAIKSTGGINAIAFQTAIKYQDKASLGLEVAKLTGTSDWERSIYWTPEAQDMVSETLEDTVNTLSRDFSAIRFKIGSNFHFSPRFDLGFSITPKVELDVTGNRDGVDVADAVFIYTKFDSTSAPLDSLTYSQYTLPLNARVGFTYQPRNIMRTVMNFDVEYVKWSDTNPLYKDAVNFYIGIEHSLTNSIPFRFGFNYTTTYGLHADSGFVFADEISTPTFTTGTGFTILDNFVFDISLEYANRSYETLDLFMDSYYDIEDLWENYFYLNLQDRSWENPDTVNETFINLKTAISYKW